MTTSEKVGTGIVYVTQDVMVRGADGAMQRKFNTEPAQQYGSVRTLLAGNTRMFSSVHVVRMLKEQLRSFSENDYLLLLGDPSVMAAASAIASARNGGRFKILVWDRMMFGYVPVQIDISGKAL
jgi:hypothetical protein